MPNTAIEDGPEDQVPTEMSLSGRFSIFGCANSDSTKNDKAAYGDEKGQNTSSVEQS